MFVKYSRYRQFPDVVTIDIKGRRLPSKSARLLPPITGTFLHTVEAGDRLDQLAFKYYQQPRKWWRICDANPAFLSPQALLGKELVITVRFPVTTIPQVPLTPNTQPSWANLVRTLTAYVAVEDVQVFEEVSLVNEVEHYDRAVQVTFNPSNLKLNDLASVIEAAGFTTLAPEWVGRVGKQIIIPTDVIG